ncbi:MAG: zf-HC2 domain-containing protein [Streptosporangiaceae bacterium]
MTCLGERLTALVDGELGHDERDRALAHLASCVGCRHEADTMRALKRRLSSLNEFPAATDLMSRLYGMGEAVAPVQAVPAMSPARAGAQQAHQTHQVRRPADNRPPARYSPGRGRRRISSARYLVAGAATLAALGAGTASLVVSGDGPRLPSSPPSYAQMNVQLQNDAKLPRKAH